MREGPLEEQVPGELRMVLCSATTVAAAPPLAATAVALAATALAQASLRDAG